MKENLSLVVRVNDVFRDLPVDHARVEVTSGAFKVGASMTEGRATFNNLNDGFYVVEAMAEGHDHAVINLGLTSDCNLLMHIREGGGECAKL